MQMNFSNAGRIVLLFCAKKFSEISEDLHSRAQKCGLTRRAADSTMRQRYKQSNRIWSSPACLFPGKHNPRHLKIVPALA
jgi:hypothetical protein